MLTLALSLSTKNGVMIKLSEIEALMVLVDLVQESDELPAKARLEIDGKVKWLLKQHEKISDPQWTLYHRKWKATSQHDEFYESAITVLKDSIAETRHRACAWMWAAAIAAGVASATIDENNISAKEMKLIQRTRKQLGVSITEQYVAFGKLPHTALEELKPCS